VCATAEMGNIGKWSAAACVVEENFPNVLDFRFDRDSKKMFSDAEGERKMGRLAQGESTARLGAMQSKQLLNYRQKAASSFR